MPQITRLPETVLKLAVAAPSSPAVAVQDFTTIKGDPGPYYTPVLSGRGDLSWSNNGGLPNPVTVNIQGPSGPPGKDAQITALSNLEIKALLT